jgi:hypothetical protein
MRTFVFHSKPSKKRRYTVAGILSEDGKTMNIGSAIHFSKKETYLRKRGKDIAVGRAKKNPMETIEIVDSKSVGKEFIKYAENLNVQKQIDFYTRIEYIGFDYRPDLNDLDALD